MKKGISMHRTSFLGSIIYRIIVRVKLITHITRYRKDLDEGTRKVSEGLACLERYITATKEDPISYWGPRDMRAGEDAICYLRQAMNLIQRHR